MTQCTVDEDCSSWGLVEYTCGATPSLCADGCNNPIGCLWCGQPTNENYRASACFNCLDDDGDGAIDCADPDCSCVRFGDEICAGGTSYTCGSSNLCQSLSCGGSTYRCVYDSSTGRYYWSTSLPSGFCCSDNDCGYDSNNVKMLCDSPNGTDNPQTQGYTYTCYSTRCQYNSEVKSGYCCDADSSIDPACRGSGVGVPAGTIICNGKYLCDPPNGFVSTSEEVSEVNKNLNGNLVGVLRSYLNVFVEKFLSIF